jgi:ATP-binding cassette subfamily B protein RaxB
MIGSVTQHDTLFAGSIVDNIAFFDPQVDLQRVEQSARIAAIHTDIVKMPMAFGTMIGYLGAALSGGQQQRILLARALYKQPKILILDEATSHLDIRSELLVTAGVRALNITRILVAHRPQTAATADRIVTLEAGRIVQDHRLTPNIAALHGLQHQTPTGTAECARDRS